MPKKQSDGSVFLDPDDDAPELTEDFFRRAEITIGDKVIRRGRPPVPNPKQLVTLRFPADTLAKLRARGRGWQSLVVAAVEKELAREEV